MESREEELNFFDYCLLYKRIFDLKMMELFEEPSTYEDDLED